MQMNGWNVVVVVLVAWMTLFSEGESRMAYVLPDGSDSLVANMKTTFSCDNLPYGYYADVDNDCKIFHVCQPITDADGQLIETAHFSFVCGNQTIFNQESLTCAFPEDSLDCADAPSLFDLSNANFGVIP